jgi:hypothetical protein
MISRSEMVEVERKCVMHTTGITVIKNQVLQHISSSSSSGMDDVCLHC